MPVKPTWPTGKVGFVAIVGRPNVGKSTFLNTVLDYHLVAVSDKPQTTRGRWRGILTGPDSQMVFVDTPGAHTGKTRLGEAMLDAVDRALQESDAVLAIFDATRPHGDEDELVATRLNTCRKPLVVAINKTDAATPEQVEATWTFLRNHLREKPAQVFEMAAGEARNTDAVVNFIRDLLPRGPFFYEADQISDSIERDIGAELIRESALEKLNEEVPHALAVEILSWKEAPAEVKIVANLHVERESQVGIVVGAQGAMLNAIRRDAVVRLRELLGGEHKVNLKLHVKLTQGWRNEKRFLKAFGLGGDQH